MKIFLASDHAGFEHKETLAAALRAGGHEVVDMGPHAFDPADDYPDFCIPLARAVAGEPGSFGVVLGGSGQGEAMAANRIKGARAAVYYGGESKMLALSREHNDANILALGARFLSKEDVLAAAMDWFSSPFSGDERHVRRIRKLDE